MLQEFPDKVTYELEADKELARLQRKARYATDLWFTLLVPTEMDTFGTFSALFFQREATSMTSSLLPYKLSPSGKGVWSTGKQCAPWEKILATWNKPLMARKVK